MRHAGDEDDFTTVETCETFKGTQLCVDEEGTAQAQAAGHYECKMRVMKVHFLQVHSKKDGDNNSHMQHQAQKHRQNISRKLSHYYLIALRILLFKQSVYMWSFVATDTQMLL